MNVKKKLTLGLGVTALTAGFGLAIPVTASAMAGAPGPNGHNTNGLCEAAQSGSATSAQQIPHAEPFEQGFYCSPDTQ